eukprot:15442240-Alexandrium_andersonii.AAC.1
MKCDCPKHSALANHCSDAVHVSPCLPSDCLALAPNAVAAYTSASPFASVAPCTGDGDAAAV